MLFSSAKRGARGKADTNRVTYPNYVTESALTNIILFATNLNDHLKVLVECAKRRVRCELFKLSCQSEINSIQEQRRSYLSFPRQMSLGLCLLSFAATQNTAHPRDADLGLFEIMITVGVYGHTSCAFPIHCLTTKMITSWIVSSSIQPYAALKRISIHIFAFIFNYANQASCWNPKR